MVLQKGGGFGRREGGGGLMPYPDRLGGGPFVRGLMSEHFTNALLYKVLFHLFIHSFIKCIPNANRTDVLENLCKSDLLVLQDWISSQIVHSYAKFMKDSIY